MQNSISKFTFNFCSKQVARNFPFFIQLDVDHKIMELGNQLKHVFPEATINFPFSVFFSLKLNGSEFELPLINHEILDTEFQISSITQNIGQLNGQFHPLNDGFIFIGWPDENANFSIANTSPHLGSNYDHSSNKSTIKSGSQKPLNFAIEDNEFNEIVQNRKLSLVASTNINGVILTDLSGVLTWVNDSFKSITGYSNEEAIGSTLLDLGVSPLTDTKVLKAMLTSFSKGTTFDHELYHKKKNNKSFWARLNGQPILDADGNLSQYFIIIEDISKAKKINQQLKDSESRLSSLILNLQTGILLEDENRKILLVNKTFCSMFGMNVNPDDLIGSDCKDSAQQIKGLFKDNENFVERINDIIANKETIHQDELALADGTFYERQYVPIIIDDEFRGNLWSYSDITLNKKYEDSLNHEKEKYRSIIDNMNIGLIEVNNDDVILLANQQFCQMSGYPLKMLIGHKGSDLFLSESQKLKIKDKKSQRQLGLSDSYEITIKNRLGEERIWLISGAPNYNLNGEVIGSIGLHFDITDLKFLEKQQQLLVAKLEKQNEQLLDYAQVVSHDLKSPLRSIHSLITFIKEDTEVHFDDKTQSYFKLIQEKTEKMDSLIHGILTYSKIENIEISNDLININDLVNNIKKIIFIPSHVTIAIKNELPIIKNDTFRMQQLFQNLISNAVNYIDKPSGVVEITSEEKSDHHIFSIKDNGIGIALKNQKKIFEMFQTLNSNYKSTGIGLSIVRRILKNSDEKIWIESKVGSGTTFFFTLKK